MKHYLLALSLLLAGTTASAQSATPAPVTLPVDADTHLITYLGIIAVPGAAKNELYARGKIWFGTSFYSVESIIKADYQQAGFIVSRGFTFSDVIVWYTIKLSFQEGRYRYILTDFRFTGSRRGVGGRNHSSISWPSSAEALCFPKDKDGTPISGANDFSIRLDQIAQRMVASIESGMSQAAGGSAW